MKQAQNQVLLVGNYIKQQFVNQQVLAVDDFLAKFKQDRLPLNQQFLIGQGLSSEQRRSVERYSNKESQLSLKKASTALTHKTSDSNVMISDPKWIAEDCYESQLMLDDRCSDMSDHLTGQHIQAMVLVEAARQLNTAVCEKFLIDEAGRANIGLVLDQLETRFKRYIYPCPVTLRYELVKIRKTPAGFFKATSKIVFVQNEEVCTEIILHFSGMDTVFLTEKEDSGIEELVNSMTQEKNSVKDENE